jgi:hypothetical protein
MGLFDSLTEDQNQGMTPPMAFVTSLVYMMSADGQIHSEEVGHLISVLGGSREQGTMGVRVSNQKFLDRAIAYRSKNSVDTFLKEVTPILNDIQKVSILLNLADSALVNGDFGATEKEIFNKFMTSFGMSDPQMRPLLEAITIKNDHTIFFK